MSTFSNKAPIFVVSDVHLGAIRSLSEKFNDFLTDIIDEVIVEDLQVLVIAGDFFDLCTETRDFISEDYSEIFDKLAPSQ